ncbi:MAG: hypothetical protein R6U46_04335 [Marinilabilia sp.]
MQVVKENDDQIEKGGALKEKLNMIFLGTKKKMAVQGSLVGGVSKEKSGACSLKRSERWERRV